LGNIVISSFESRKILKDFQPDICVGTGGYVCGPFLREAANLKIPFLIHDSNSYPGITTKLLAKKAEKVLIINEDVKKHLPKNINTCVTGTPVRAKIITQDKKSARKSLNLSDNPTILSFGGSLGARAINEVMAKIMAENKTDFNFIHGFGKNYSDFTEKLEENGLNTKNNPRYIIKQYIDNMSECLAAADLVICRAGATTLSELQACLKPSILIPSPNVAENHQYYNALSLVKSGCASMIEEKDLTAEKLLAEIKNIFEKDKIKEYSENLKKVAITDADKVIYDIILDVVGKK
jgi:UDP-N-acetylglucosamine--N-acetylmuramyl-(pentapeptide) pyrophosphoryl-undecaprenol N-acetylglucosamine transferase